MKSLWDYFQQETQNVAKVLPSRNDGTQLKSKKLDSKQWVEICSMGGLVTLGLQQAMWPKPHDFIPLQIRNYDK